MKLNLLPTNAAKGKGNGFAWVVCVVMIAASAGCAFMMGQTSKKEIDKWSQRAEGVKPAYDAAVQVSGYAADVVERSKGVIVNAALAKEMIDHNLAYPAFYDKLMPYIPSFFRITEMRAVPSSADTVTVTLSGVIKTHEQYADIMIAFNRIPEVQTVSRSMTRAGYAALELNRPGLVQTDQTGRPVSSQTANIPDDPMERLNYFITQGRLTGFESNTFGTGQPGYRGAMPNWSEITITLVMPGKLQAPDPKATLNAVSSGTTPAANTSNVSGPMMPGMAGPMAGAPPSGAEGATPMAGGKEEDK